MKTQNVDKATINDPEMTRENKAINSTEICTLDCGDGELI